MRNEKGYGILRVFGVLAVILIGAPVVILGAISLFDLDGLPAPSEVKSQVDANNYELPHQLAIINADHWVEPDDLTVKRFGYLLRALSDKTGLPQQKVGDMAAKTRNIINDQYGRDVTELRLMEDANNEPTVASGEVKLSDYWALYTVLAGQ